MLLLVQMLSAATLLFGQQDEPMKLISSLRSRIDGVTGHMINYQPVYEHKGSSLRADSGYLYTDDLGREYFDAFGNVVITQPDGTVIYARKLNYAADPQLAILTGNVRMVDGESTLTTNYLTYNMRNSIGTYTGGGRIVNQADTITSKNAWYFNRSKDAYFRYDVIVRTPDVQIYTDTMRYNSDAKTTYFYGPTNLKGKDGENLYTEEGYYNTETELAEFFKNNLYTETSRFLKGDTLYYDGKQGIGRALRHVLFVDTADQFFASGHKALYNKEEESIMMTDRPLITMVMDEDEEEEEDTDADTDADGVTDAGSEGLEPALTTPQNSAKVDSVYLTADTLYSRMILLSDYVPMDFQLDREGGPFDEDSSEFDEEMSPPDGVADRLQDSTAMELDSMTLELDSMTLELDSTALDSLRQILPRTDSLKTSEEMDTIAMSAIEQDLAADSLLREHTQIPTGMEADSMMAQATESLRKDSIQVDTAKTRIIKAYRNVRLFKSDLQAVADSAYYGYPDSMLRFFGAPMAWTQGSQMSGDSLYLQIKNEKMDNMLLLGHAFIVNTKDSVKFNQIKGRKVTGFFTNGDLDRTFVDGNAESIAYMENKSKTGYTDMYHSRSSRIKLLFQDNDMTDFIPIRSTEGTIYPLRTLTQDQEILEGFIWKPGDRPTSKEDLLNRKRAAPEPIELEPPDADPDADPVEDPVEDPDSGPDSVPVEDPDPEPVEDPAEL